MFIGQSGSNGVYRRPHARVRHKGQAKLNDRAVRDSRR
jgi:hypothetical protein